MKSLNYTLLISLAVLMSAADVFGCGIDICHPKEYRMYRVLSDEYKERYIDLKEENCLAWQALTSPEIPLEHIREIVYDISLEDIELLRSIRNYRGNNLFAEWITSHNREILDFLYLAKVNQSVRFHYLSHWYYPTMEIDAPMDLPRVIEIAEADNSYLRDRYLLQAIRAHTTLGEYREVIDLWHSEMSHLPEENVMRRLALSYVAGAMSRFDDCREEAIKMFVELGDISSVLFVLNKRQIDVDEVDILEIILQSAPNSPRVIQHLDRVVSELEYKYKFSYGGTNDLNENDLDDARRLIALSLRAAADERVNDPALWYYTASMLQIIIGEMDVASQTLVRAERCPASQYMKDSIRVMRIYLDAHLRPYDGSYMPWLMSQIKWFEQMIDANIDDKVEERTMDFYYLHYCWSYYYWNDMMRHILLSVVVPRMYDNGDAVEALQLANISSYMLVNKIDKTTISHPVFRSRSDRRRYTMEPKIVSIDEYRNNRDYINDLDFQTAFFKMADSIDVKHLVAYYERTIKPQGDTDSYLNQHSYVDKDFLCDIIGTQYIRQMEYDKAVSYLSNVNVKYDNCLNVQLYYDPFCFEQDPIESMPNFRYDFALRMLELENKIASEQDADRRAKLMIEYATGLRTSFGRCWQLGFYVYGYRVVMSDSTQRNELLRKKAFKRYEKMVLSAIDTAEDKELIADIMYQFSMHKSLAELYPYTQKGQLVRGECDRLIDYQGISNTWRYW